jgi:hypothetical protein
VFERHQQCQFPQHPAVIEDDVRVRVAMEGGEYRRSRDDRSE